MNSIHLEELPYQTDSTVLFNRLRQLPGAVFLDSAYPFSDAGRYDVMAASPTLSREFDPYSDKADVLEFARELKDQHDAFCGEVFNPSEDIPFCGGIIGYLSYDTGRRLEQLSDNNDCAVGGLTTSHLSFYPWCVLQDHLLQRCLFIALPHVTSKEREMVLAILRDPLVTGPAKNPFELTIPFTSNISEATYRESILQIQRYILAGDCYQVNFAQRFTAGYQGDPWEAYAHLRTQAAAPYSAYLDLGNSALLSVSPEQFIRLRGNHVQTRPIKGTRPRGSDRATDELLALELRNSSKDRAENLMIVDLLRNDLGKCCEPGSIHVDQLFASIQLPNVHHLVSTISGKLSRGKNAFDLLTSCFPGGSITGAPKKRAMEIIDELEDHSRGAYCGSVVYISADGGMDSNIAIRTLQCENSEISCWGGGGIVSDSEWQKEYQETHDKVGNLLRALQQGPKAATP